MLSRILFDAVNHSHLNHFNFIPTSNNWYQKISDDGKLVLSIDVPGYNEKNLSVSVDNNIVKIAGEKSKSNKVALQYSVPSSWNVEQLEADVTDGILTLTFSKATSSKKIEFKKR
jgi:HSP20 family molecular chaperone IbpA